MAFRAPFAQYGNMFTTALDQSTNAIVRNTIFEVTPLGTIEFTVFGKTTDSLPAAQPSPSVCDERILWQSKRVAALSRRHSAAKARIFR